MAIVTVSSVHSASLFSNQAPLPSARERGTAEAAPPVYLAACVPPSLLQVSGYKSWGPRGRPPTWDVIHLHALVSARPPRPTFPVLCAISCF